MNDREIRIAILDKAIELLRAAQDWHDEHWYLCHAIDGAAVLLTGTGHGYFSSIYRDLPPKWESARRDLRGQIRGLLGRDSNGDTVFTLEEWVSEKTGVQKPEVERVHATRIAWAQWLKEQQ